jgi:hypothetical protein
MPTTIQIRRSTQNEWNTNSSIVLLAGEAGYETDTGNVKIGDGSTTWANLKYQLPYNTGARTSVLTDTLTIDNANDRVGIGAGSPTEKLSVGGNAAVSGNITAGGTLGVAGNVAVNTSAFTVAAATGNTTVAGTLGVTGLTTLSNDLAINHTGSADITTTTTTATVFNTTATTLNIGGAATTVAIGASNGTTTIPGSLSAGATTLSSLALTTDLAIAQGGTGASDAAGARTNLGLLGMALQAANAVAITGGTISGITDLAVADGGTGASTAATARENIGVYSAEAQASYTGTQTVTLALSSVPIGQMWSKVYTQTQNGGNQTFTLNITHSGAERAIIFASGITIGAISYGTALAIISDIAFSGSNKVFNTILTDPISASVGTTLSYGFGNIGATTRSFTIFILRTK